MKMLKRTITLAAAVLFTLALLAPLAEADVRVYGDTKGYDIATDFEYAIEGVKVKIHESNHGPYKNQDKFHNTSSYEMYLPEGRYYDITWRKGGHDPMFQSQFFMPPWLTELLNDITLLKKIDE